jgi:hypothetical protein
VPPTDERFDGTTSHNILIKAPFFEIVDKKVPIAQGGGCTVAL